MATTLPCRSTVGSSDQVLERPGNVPVAPVVVPPTIPTPTAVVHHVPRRRRRRRNQPVDHGGAGGVWAGDISSPKPRTPPPPLWMPVGSGRRPTSRGTSSRGGDRSSRPGSRQRNTGSRGSSRRSHTRAHTPLGVASASSLGGWGHASHVPSPLATPTAPTVVTTSHPRDRSDGRLSPSGAIGVTTSGTSRCRSAFPTAMRAAHKRARAVSTHSIPHGTGPSTVQPPGTAGALPSHAACHCRPRRAPRSNHDPPGGRAERITRGAPGCSGEQHRRIQRGIAAHVGRPTAQASTRQPKPVPKPRDGVERGQERWSHRPTLPWCSVPVGAWLGLSGWCLQHGQPQRRCVRLVAAVAQYWPSGRRRHTRTRGCDRCGEEPAWARRCRTTIGQHNTITGPAAFRGVTQRDGSAFHPDASGHNPARAGHAVTVHV